MEKLIRRNYNEYISYYCDMLDNKTYRIEFYQLNQRVRTELHRGKRIPMK